MMKRLLPQISSILVAGILLTGCQKNEQQKQSEPAKSPAENIGSPTWPDKLPKEIDFAKHVRPILVINCLECHNDKDASKYKGVNLQHQHTAVDGRIIKPGDPKGSLLIQVLDKDQAHDWKMPPTPDGIWGIRLELLERWIEEGAKWPEGYQLEHPADVKEW